MVVLLLMLLELIAGVVVFKVELLIGYVLLAAVFVVLIVVSTTDICVPLSLTKIPPPQEFGQNDVSSDR